MNILVTGATGFLGHHLCRALVEAGHHVVPLGSRDADLRDARSLQAFIGERYDQVYHLAAWTQAGDFCLHHPGEQWVINQQINTNVLAWWHEHQPQAKLIAMGSSCCYDPGEPLREDRFLEGQPIESLFAYGMTKRMLYVGLRVLQQQFGLRYLCLVPSTLYGPGYHLDGRQMHFIFDLIRKIVEASQGGPAVSLWGDGHQRRELIHVQDFVRAALHLGEHVENELVNVGSGKEYAIRWYAERICEEVGYDPALIEYDTSKYTGATSKVMHIDKLRSLMPEFETTPIEDGLKQTIEWFIGAHA